MYTYIMKFKERLEAIELRKKGWMLPAIKDKLGVSKATVSLWLRDIALNEDQQRAVTKGRDKSRFIGGEKKKNARKKITEEITAQGIREGRDRSKDSFFVSGLMLYWAEGAKSEETIKFSNSDPAMIRFMMKWFRDVCGVEDKKFRISVHIHSLHSSRDCEAYWSKITKISRNQFYKTQIKKTSLGQRKKILYEGTCTICVGNKNLFRKMNGWRIGALEKMGINV